MNVLISGGCKNGKSTFGENLLCHLWGGEGTLYYLAAMQPTDGEDLVRIACHQRNRAGRGFVTIERGIAVEGIVGGLHPADCLLVESTTAILANEMFGQGSVPDMRAPRRVIESLCALFVVRHLVIVSDTIYSDASPFSKETDCYRRGLAAVDRALAERCDTVIEVVYGMPVLHKGTLSKEQEAFYQ